MKQRKLFAISLGGLLIVLGVFIWMIISNPFIGESFVTVDIPAPDSFKPNGDWIYSRFSIWTNEDGETYYLWRREAQLFSGQHPDGYDISQLGEVERYFINNLDAKQWILDTMPNYDLCIKFIPEARFIKDEKSLLSFSLEEKTTNGETPVLCILSWKDNTVDDVPEIRIILITVSE